MSRRSWIESGKIVALAILASVVYGIIHDQITIRRSPAYFTDWQVHADFFHHQNLTVVALFWGVVATWWVGLILGILLAGAANIGKTDPWTWKQVLRPLFIVMATTGILAVMGYQTSQALGFTVPSSVVNFWMEDSEGYVRFSAVWVAHTVSYVAAGVGGLGLSIHILQKRRYSAA